jgi:hypothetical protein
MALRGVIAAAMVHSGGCFRLQEFIEEHCASGSCRQQ